MFDWLRQHLLPKKLEKEIVVISIKNETEQLERAVKDLSDQTEAIKKERTEMTHMLDEVLREVGGKRR